MLVALGEVLLYLSSTMPTARLALVAIAGMLPAIAVLTGGIPAGLGVYAATAALGLLIVPSKGAVAVYALMLGHYAMVKSFAERMTKRHIEWIIKLAVFNIVITVAVFALGELIFDFVEIEWAKWLIYIAGNIAFIIYDFGFSGLITIFITRFGKYLHGGSKR